MAIVSKMTRCAACGSTAVTVDGKKTKAGLFADCMYSIELPKGEHEIVMKYHTPGLRLGAVLSILMVFVLGIIEYAGSRKRKNYGRRRYFTWI